MNETYYDDLLQIKTIEEQKGFNESYHYHRYEPTPYHALKSLFSNYKVSSEDRFVDFGCGKGRLNFFIHYNYGATVVGIEMNEQFYEDALHNLISYDAAHKNDKNNIHFVCCLAEEYEIHQEDNRFYFFNPFSIQIFMKIISNIIDSYHENEREIEIILYYSSSDYEYFMENHYAFVLKEEVDIPGLFERNKNERFLIYKLQL